MIKTVQIIFRSFLFILILSCNGQHDTNESVSESKVIPDSQSFKFDGAKSTTQPVINSSSEDPYFVLSKDTTSIYGPHSITRNVIQDRNGNYWLATWEGIIRYDGKVFTNITLKEGLKHFHVFSVLEDRIGNLWFGTIGGGAYRYDGKSFTLFTMAMGLVDNVILWMLDDKAGNVWFATSNGVSRCRYDGYAFTNFTMQDGLSSNSVNSISQDRTGKLWFATNSGVSCYDPSASLSAEGKAAFTNYTNKEGFPFTNVRSILADNSDSDRKGKIWIGSGYGLWLFDPSTSVAGEKAITNFTKNFTGNIFQDKTGNVWLSESEDKAMTLYRYDGKSFSKIIEKNSSKDFFFNQIFGVTEDRDGKIWFGTATGVCRYDPSTSLRAGGKSFENFTGDVSKE